MQEIDFKKFIKYSKAGPRYTSYPTAIEFSEDYKYESYIKDLQNDTSPLSLYIHLPFCRSACYFCGCNVIYTSKDENKQKYIEYLKKELDIIKDSINCTKSVHQLHFGGGTPTFFNAQELECIISMIKSTFTNFSNDAEIACEVDVRYFNEDQMKALKNGGFNRLSFGVQDFDEKVQTAVHRIQPLALVENATNIARKYGIESINFDLIYGLPYQNLKTFKTTLETCIKLDPDRLAIFNYAHVPWIKKTMRKIDETKLPTPDEKLQILENTILFLQSNGYKMIGMDHFAKPNDELFKSIQKGELRRNFQGYSTKGGTQTIGIGITSIGEGLDYYAQNHKDLPSYQKAIDSGKLPFFRGIKLSFDDICRKAVIMNLMSNFKLDFKSIENEFNINFKDYFKESLNNLEELEEAGLISIADNKIEVSPTGTLMIRNIAMAFDSYLNKIEDNKKVFSKTI
ncbi:MULTISPECIES: oxygen-independent coproporphyrinogen III oxidase [Helicobacter]|uniref:Coproporphyrinogen-III oxidase n=1 Tax=Helicobacter ibis TaxID=2962633 RepID=A0ABT4VEH8_9HELI|nr:MULTISPECIES: oxygen-independent coproporphyrinogen III oxidase [Helicobacter]MDA3966687.1 oxygen-independent coproporphyrinogen III oxidase [Helicobacter sp. WB40]MDA3968545.1 oxygen-independent coproporphyrinogen III oxidase [Helicobacter ibis]